METRKYKVSIRGCGGNAKGAQQYSIGLPTKWMRLMNIAAGERDVEISFDGSEIRIRKVEGAEKVSSAAE